MCVWGVKRYDILPVMMAKGSIFVLIFVRKKRREMWNSVNQDMPYLDAYTFNAIALLWWICLWYISIKFLIIFIPFNRIQCFFFFIRISATATITATAAVQVINSIVIILYWMHRSIAEILIAIVTVVCVFVDFTWF